MRKEKSYLKKKTIFLVRREKFIENIKLDFGLGSYH